MLKVFYILSAVAALLINSIAGESCLFAGFTTWETDNPNQFAKCDATTNEPNYVDCNQDKGYIAGRGCFSWDIWSGRCPRSIISTMEPDCLAESYRQPQMASDPNYFYVCPAKDATPLKLKCPTGKGFISDNKYLGCFLWAKWRQITGCLVENSILE